MDDWKKKLADQLAAGEKPSYDDLEAALHGALSERAMFEQNMLALAQWLGKMSAAFLAGDAGGLADLMAAFVQERVLVNPPNKDKSH